MYGEGSQVEEAFEEAQFLARTAAGWEIVDDDDDDDDDVGSAAHSLGHLLAAASNLALASVAGIIPLAADARQQIVIKLLPAAGDRSCIVTDRGTICMHL